MNLVNITSLRVKSQGGMHMAEYDYVVTDPLGKKAAGNGKIATSALEAVESQVRFNLEKKLGYTSFDVRFPVKPVAPIAAEAKRPVLGVAR